MREKYKNRVFFFVIRSKQILYNNYNNRLVYWTNTNVVILSSTQQHDEIRHLNVFNAYAVLPHQLLNTYNDRCVAVMISQLRSLRNWERNIIILLPLLLTTNICKCDCIWLRLLDYFNSIVASLRPWSKNKRNIDQLWCQ